MSQGAEESSPSGDSSAPADAPRLPLLEPSGGVPPVLSTLAQINDAAAALAAGTGPVALDAERASGYRYSQRAYLIQIKREGAGSFLIDPTEVDDLGQVQRAISSDEWILHAASQDLPCLREVGLRPTVLFDTELAGRLAGMERVGLGPMVEQVLGLRLEKGHGAADWSSRPLPEPWLRYAVLDVEVLVELRHALAADLDRQGKTEWARQEFAAVVAAAAPPPRVDPWRRVSGMHKVRKARGLAVVRELWHARDDIARSRDIAPGRILQDVAIVNAALADPPPLTRETLTATAGFKGRGAARHLPVWLAAISRAYALKDADLPPTVRHGDGPPHPRNWADRNPEAANRLVIARRIVTDLADRHRIPVENLLTPDHLRRLCWTPPWGDLAPTSETAVASAHEFLEGLGARTWQRELVLTDLLPALAAPPTQE